MGEQEICLLQLHLSETEIVRRGGVQQIGRLVDHLGTFATIKSPGLSGGVDRVIIPLQKVILG
jgi:hypothetical protein